MSVLETFDPRKWNTTTRIPTFDRSGSIPPTFCDVEYAGRHPEELSTLFVCPLTNFMVQGPDGTSVSVRECHWASTCKYAMEDGSNQVPWYG